MSKMSNKTLVYSVAGGCPVFFEYEDELFPTVYTLWEYPGMLQTVFTYSEVMRASLDVVHINNRFRTHGESRTCRLARRSLRVQI